MDSSPYGSEKIREVPAYSPANYSALLGFPRHPGQQLGMVPARIPSHVGVQPGLPNIFGPGGRCQARLLRQVGTLDGR